MAAVSPGVDRWRWPLSALMSALVVVALVWMMQALIAAPAAAPLAPTTIGGVHLVAPPPSEPPVEPPSLAQVMPPPPPAMPPALPAAALPAVAAPALSTAVASVDVAALGVPVQLGGGLGLTGSGAFGGFARGGGAGGAGADYGRGEHFSGRELVPLGTARPQMPEWACRQKIKGWIEVVFTELPSGQVTDVRIVDAEPRGVFEAAAIESVSHWIYAASKETREVEQRVDMDPADCAYNWH